MKAPARVWAVAIVGASLVALPACSVDAAIWGPDGARVIETTEQLIDAAVPGEQGSFACPDFDGDFGDAQAWDGTSAGEPEQFDAETSVDRPSLDAAWRINLEGSGVGAAPGEAVPTDVFYRETDGSLCVADIIWQPVER